MNLRTVSILKYSAVVKQVSNTINQLLNIFLFVAAKFLQENGLILHFDDHLRGLNNLFFIDPSWLIDMVALVVTVRERNPYVQRGYINERELMVILEKNPSLPNEFIPQVFNETRTSK